MARDAHLWHARLSAHVREIDGSGDGLVEQDILALGLSDGLDQLFDFDVMEIEIDTFAFFGGRNGAKSQKARNEQGEKFSRKLHNQAAFRNGFAVSQG